MEWTVSSMDCVELEPVYDSRISFYGKAQVTTTDDGRVLYSYGTPVARCRMSNGLVELFPAWDYSPTTLRHVKEFIRQTYVIEDSMTRARMEDYTYWNDKGLALCLWHDLPSSVIV